MLQRLPDRISQGVVVNGVVPRNYIPDHALPRRKAPLVPIDSARQFAADNADCIRSIEEPNGGGLLSLTHIDTVLRLAKDNDTA